eukprot:m.216396 g.216396  ORF g.216396 m.216396 type:complete len:144 (+) comp39867_c0_seq3:405-836(+)
MEDKVVQYETFVNDVLKRDLKRTHDQRDAVLLQLTEYNKLRELLCNIKCDDREMKTQIDLGCNFYAQARVNDPSRIFLSIGLGCYVEMTHDEALSYMEKKEAQLKKRCSDLIRQSAYIQAQIKLVLEGLNEIQFQFGKIKTES